MNVLTIDLSALSTAQLFGLRQVLTTGNLAVADSKEVRQLRKENAALKKQTVRRDAVESAGLDWDQDYWMAFDDDAFNYFLNLFIDQKSKAEKELALSEATRSMKIPQIILQQDLNDLDVVRSGLNELRNRRNGGMGN